MDIQKPLLLLSSFTLSLCSFSILATPWEELRKPSEQPPQSIGSYANGCLEGASALPIEGEGYQILRPQRARYYGHPNAIAYIQRLASQTSQQLDTQLLIADISLPQGGRFSSGHSSHQTGLDIDIWLRFSDAKLTSKELEKPEPYSVVNLERYKLLKEQWQQEHFDVIKAAANDAEVARIFVHPVIKQKLCDAEGPKERAWLRRIRPWWGHHYHMHVRLNCPKNSNDCTPQAAPPKGDGCGAELASWKPQPKPILKKENTKAKHKAKEEKSEGHA